MERPRLVVIVGPTASGKTGLGIALAKRFNGEVISADSRQIYRGMDVGTAKPAGEWLEANLEGMKGNILSIFGGGARRFEVEGVPHWGIDVADPDEDFNVSQFKTYAEARIKDIVKRSKLPILVGGTGLWVDAVVDNVSLPDVPPNAKIRAELEPRSADDLFAEFKRLDPTGAEVIDCHNKRRLVRALEVTRVTGKPFSSQQVKGEPQYDVLKIGLDVEKEELDRRISTRVDEMIANGLVNEVRALLKRFPPLRGGTTAEGGQGGGELPIAMSGIGYRQIAYFLNGKANLTAAIDDVKKDTRAYAKRQLTWFKRDPRIQWLKQPQEAEVLVEKFVE